LSNPSRAQSSATSQSTIWKVFVLCTLLLYIPGSIYSQGTSRLYNYQLKFSPLRLIDAVNPGIELSLERSHGQHYSTQLSISRLADPFNISTHINYQGWRISLEEKYLFGPHDDFKYYGALELVVHQIDIRRTDRFSESASYDLALTDSTYAEAFMDTYEIDKQMLTLNLKGGVQSAHGRFLMDFGFGLGVKFKRIDHLERDDPSLLLVGGRHPSFIEPAIREGRYAILNIPINLKVAWLF